MAWIESHQDLARHPKVKRFARALHIKDTDLAHHAAISLLHHLWWWSMDYAEDGDLTRFTAEDIADACQWPTRKATALVDALTATGWLDRDGESLRVHDYEYYIARLLHRREENAQRARTARARRAQRAGSERAACGATGTGTGTGTSRAAHAPAHASRAVSEKDAAEKSALERAIALANYIDPIDPTLPREGAADA